MAPLSEESAADAYHSAIRRKRLLILAVVAISALVLMAGPVFFNIAADKYILIVISIALICTLSIFLIGGTWKHIRFWLQSRRLGGDQARVTLEMDDVLTHPERYLGRPHPFKKLCIMRNVNAEHCVTYADDVSYNVDAPASTSVFTSFLVDDAGETCTLESDLDHGWIVERAERMAATLKIELVDTSYGTTQ